MTIFLDQEPIQLSNGIQGNTWAVNTGNPVSFYQAISESADVTPTTIFAQTFIPPGGTKPGIPFPEYALYSTQQ